MRFLQKTSETTPPSTLRWYFMTPSMAFLTKLISSFFNFSTVSIFIDSDSLFITLIWFSFYNFSSVSICIWVFRNFPTVSVSICFLHIRFVFSTKIGYDFPIEFFRFIRTHYIEFHIVLCVSFVFLDFPYGIWFLIFKFRCARPRLFDFQISLCPALFDFQKLKIRCARLRFWISMHMDFHGFRCARKRTRSSIDCDQAWNSILYLLCLSVFAFFPS